MTTGTAERIARYSANDIRNIIANENLTGDDITFLASISTFGMVGIPMGDNVPRLAGLRTVDVPVFNVSNAPTGVFMGSGAQPVIIINEESSILDYDLISHLHPNHDWDVYLWISRPWQEAGSSFGINGEWYRRDVYPDGIEPFDGTLDWADIVVQLEED